MRRMILRLLVIYSIVMTSSIWSHPGGHDESESDTQNNNNNNKQISVVASLNDVRNLFLKYTNGSCANRMSLDKFLNSFLASHLSQLRPNNSSMSGAYSCYSNRIVELGVRLAKLNQTRANNSYIDSGRFAKVSSFLIANFDACYGGHYSPFTWSSSSTTSSPGHNHHHDPSHEISMWDTITSNVQQLDKKGFH